MSNKIIRTICSFEDKPSDESIVKIDKIYSVLAQKGYSIQTKRVCSPSIEHIANLDSKYACGSYIFGVGSVEREKLSNQLDKLLAHKDISFTLDLSNNEITKDDVEILFYIIANRPAKTFNFAYVFNNPPSSPFFPSGAFSRKGFSIGLQPTDLSENCSSLDEWLDNIKEVWTEIHQVFSNDPEFLGIDSSIAPLFSGNSSLIYFVKKLGFEFSHSTTTDTYVRITKYIKEENPIPVGLCGIMFPCLEDFELAEEYEKGNFNIERNIYLSLHSGLGIDTYPIATDESKERVLEILKLVQALSNKYNKPLSARFVSDGKAKIGTKTDFQNQYLKDVMVKAL